MYKSPLISSVSPTSASTTDVPASKQATTKSANDPSAKAPVETSKPLSRTQLGRGVCDASYWSVRRQAVLRRVVLRIALVAAVILTTATLLRMASPTVPPLVTASGVRQELVENGATLYGISSCASTQKQLVDLGTTEYYTQGLDYVDCEADAAFCRLMNVTSYPTWQINGQLYPGYYSLEKLLVRLSGDDDDHDDHDHDHDDLDVVTAIWCMLLITSWFLFFAWLSFPGAGACLLSPEEMKARHEAEMASRLGEARVNNLLKI